MKLPTASMLKTLFDLQKEEVFMRSEDGSMVTQWVTVASLFGRLDSYGNGVGLTRENGLTHQIVVRCNPELMIKTGQRMLSNERAFLIRGVRALDEPAHWTALFVEEQNYLVEE
jgi:hypothetical protein